MPSSSLPPVSVHCAQRWPTWHAFDGQPRSRPRGAVVPSPRRGRLQLDNFIVPFVGHDIAVTRQDEHTGQETTLHYRAYGSGEVVAPASGPRPPGEDLAACQLHACGGSVVPRGHVAAGERRREQLLLPAQALCI